MKELLPEEKRLFIEQLLEQDVINNYELLNVISYFDDANKGVRDAVSQFLVHEKYQHYRDEIAKNIAPYIEHQNIEIRNLAGDVLMKLGKFAVNSLVPYLQNESVDVIKFAADIIGLIGDSHSLEFIVPLLSSHDQNVRCAAIEAMGNIGDSSMVEILVRLYNEDEESRLYIIAALGQIGGEASENFLIQRLSDVDEMVQVAAIDALAICAHSLDAASKLNDLLSKTSKEMQVIILKTIAGIAFRNETTVPLPEDLRFIAYNALRDDDPDTRIAGLLALGTQFISEDIPFVVAEFRKSEEEIKNYILNILFSEENVELIRSFYQEFNSKEMETVELVSFLESHLQIIEDCSESIASLIVPHLAQFVRHHSSEVRIATLEILGLCNDKTSNQILSDILRSGDQDSVSEVLLVVKRHNLTAFDSEMQELAQEKAD